MDKPSDFLSLKRKAHLYPGVLRYSCCLTMGVCLSITALLFPQLWLKSCEEVRYKAAWEVCKASRTQELSGLQKCTTGFSDG